MDLSNGRVVRDIMGIYGISAQKKYGQNFLTDTGVLDSIVEGSGVSGDDTVLEIGPGLGALTQRLAAVAGRVVAVEIDSALIPVLGRTLEGCDNVDIIHADILNCDIRELNRQYGENRGLKVTANLPYYITTPIVLKLLEYSDIIDTITVMVQKEVAIRMQAGPGSKDYGALSLAVRYYSEPRVITEVPADCFYPSPAVDSAVIRLDLRREPVVDVPDEDLLFKLVRATFNMRRKTLPNALSAGVPGLTRERVGEMLDAMGKPQTVRGETFTLDEFAELTRRVYDSGDNKM